MRPTPDTPQRVLILEDDPVQAQLLERILAGGNYDAEVAHDPRALLSSSREQPTPDLLLADIRLPHLDGLTVCVRLSEDPRWCLVPVILMTASTDPALRTAADRIPTPPEAVLTRPIEPMSLLRWVRRILAADEPSLQMAALRRRHLSLTLRICRLESSEPESEPLLSRLLLSRQAIEDEVDRVRGSLGRNEAPRR